MLKFNLDIITKNCCTCQSTKAIFCCIQKFCYFPRCFSLSTTNWRTALLHYSSFTDDVQLPQPEDNSPAHLRSLPIYAQVTGHNPSSAIPISPSLQHTCNSLCTESSSSKFQTQSNDFCAPPSMHTHFHTRTHSQQTHTHGEKLQRIFPQFAFDLLPVFQEGEGLEDENE